MLLKSVFCYPKFPYASFQRRLLSSSIDIPASENFGRMKHWSNPSRDESKVAAVWTGISSGVWLCPII